MKLDVLLGSLQFDLPPKEIIEASRLSSGFSVDSLIKNLEGRIFNGNEMFFDTVVTWSRNVYQNKCTYSDYTV